MTELVSPTTLLHSAWLDGHAEWGPGLHEDGFGLTFADDVRSPSGFSAWVAKLTAKTVPVTYRWIVEDGRVLGGIALRHPSHHDVRWAGHIGFGIRPSSRGSGLATWALGQMHAEAHRLGMTRVLVVCEATNLASARTIERSGGVLDETVKTGLDVARHYWISVVDPTGSLHEQ